MFSVNFLIVNRLRIDETAGRVDKVNFKVERTWSFVRKTYKNRTTYLKIKTGSTDVSRISPSEGPNRINIRRARAQ